MARVPHRVPLADRGRRPVRRDPRRARAVGVGRAARPRRRARDAHLARAGGGRAHGARLPRVGHARRQPAGGVRRRARRGRPSAASTASSSASRCRASAAPAATSCSSRSGAWASSTCARRRCSSPTTRRRSPPSASSASATRCCSSAARATSPTPPSCRSRRSTSRCSTGRRRSAAARRWARRAVASAGRAGGDRRRARRLSGRGDSDTLFELQRGLLILRARRADHRRTMNPRVAIIKQLVDDGCYPIDEAAIAEAIVVRSMARRLDAGRSRFASRRRKPQVRSFRPHRGARSFRLRSRASVGRRDAPA